MAIARENLDRGDAVVLAFPASRRARHARIQARRRTAAVLCSVGLVIALVNGGGGEGAALASRAGAPAAVVLRDGQSVWDLAERYAPDGVDQRAYVDAVLELNGLSGAPPAGARIELPR